MASSNSKPRPAASGSGSGDLLPDAMYEILLRLPAREFCRLRAVCRSWRALTSGQLFIAADKSRHTDPLLAVAYVEGRRNRADSFGVVDLSGDALGRIPRVGGGTVPVSKNGDVVRVPVGEEGVHVLRARVDLICFARSRRPLGLWIFDPVTRATLALPECRSEELVRELKGERCSEVVLHAVGQVPSTGEYKALRITTRLRLGDDEPARQLCEVITFDGGSHGRWRGKQGPPSVVFAQKSCVVIRGVVYFLMKIFYLDLDVVLTVEPGSIASFNLKTEEWMGILGGPAPLRKFIQDSKDDPRHSLQLSIAEPNGCLVTAHNIHGIYMDLWFLTDIEEGIWVKKYSLPSQFGGIYVRPFLALGDGRILFTYGNCGYGLERIASYNPRNGTHAHVLEVVDCSSIGTYAGSLLSLSSTCF